jgi:hypothetical protein
VQQSQQQTTPELDQSQQQTTPELEPEQQPFRTQPQSPAVSAPTVPQDTGLELDRETVTSPTFGIEPEFGTTLDPGTEIRRDTDTALTPDFDTGLRSEAGTETSSEQEPQPRTEFEQPQEVETETELELEQEQRRETEAENFLANDDRNEDDNELAGGLGSATFGTGFADAEEALGLEDDN